MPSANSCSACFERAFKVDSQFSGWLKSPVEKPPSAVISFPSSSIFFFMSMVASIVARTIHTLGVARCCPGQTLLPKLKWPAGNGSPVPSSL